MNQCYHDVGTQVNMDDVSGPKLGVGMATLGPSLGQRYVDPSPIARHVVDADAIEGKEPSILMVHTFLNETSRFIHLCAVLIQTDFSGHKRGGRKLTLLKYLC